MRDLNVPGGHGSKFTKVQRGWYATEDGTLAVVSDGYERSQSVGADPHYEGFTGGEWALVHDPAGRLRDNHGEGDNLDWFPTMSEAVAEANRRFAR